MLRKSVSVRGDHSRIVKRYPSPTSQSPAVESLIYAQSKENAIKQCQQSHIIKLTILLILVLVHRPHFLPAEIKS